jgi:hypothetical protein
MGVDVNDFYTRELVVDVHVVDVSVEIASESVVIMVIVVAGTVVIVAVVVAVVVATLT